MKKQELLKQYPELIKEISRDVLRACQRPTDNLREFEDMIIENYLKEQTKPEPEWEILEFYDKMLNHSFEYKTTSGLSLEFFLFSNNKRFSIHSVRRTSDGDVFTANGKEKVKSPNCIEFIIKEIKLMDDKIILYSQDGQHVHLSKAIKVQSLFTTKDGVDIYAGNLFFFVKNNTVWIAKALASVDYSDYYYPTFSTKEAANEYILMYKPKLSIDQIIDCINPVTNSYDLKIIKEELIKLVKSQK